MFQQSWLRVFFKRKWTWDHCGEDEVELFFIQGSGKSMSSFLLSRYEVTLLQSLSQSDSLWPHRLQHTRFPCPSLSPSLLKLMCIELVMPSNNLILYCPLLLLPLIFSSIRVFSNELTLHIRWPKNWSFSFSISPSNEYSGLISFRIGWFDLLAIQRTLKSLLQHHSWKASILQWHLLTASSPSQT